MINVVSALKPISPRAVPIVQTGDMGLQFDYADSKGATTVLGVIASWPVYKITISNLQLLKNIQSRIINSTLNTSDIDNTDLMILYESIKSREPLSVEFGELAGVDVSHLNTSIVC